jgi:iron complex outermembrane receptor protein
VKQVLIFLLYLTDAIERVEILRDGYWYGWIAGGEHHLEKSTSGGSVTLRTGITGQGGEMYGMRKQWNKGEKGF